MFSKNHALVIISLFWIGLIVSISFFEAWVKFRTPGVNRNDLLLVGNTVFKYKSYFELVLFVFLFLVVRIDTRTFFLFFLLIFEAFYLLALLEKDIDCLISGNKVKLSYLKHLVFGVLELSKIILLYSLSSLKFLKL